MPKFPFILSAAQPGRRVPLSVGLLCGSVLLLSCFAAIHGERDFNLNESQVPVLEPKDETHHIKYTLPEDPYAIEMSRCDSADSEILLSLVLKQHDWHDFNDSRRVKVLNKLSKFFAIPKEFIVMETVKKYDLREMQKAAVRKGENKCHSSKRLLGRVNFMIGCGSSYFKAGEPIANQIGAQMRDGTIDHLTGEKFGWWIIWHKDSNVSRSQRQRRQAVEGSGDDYEYDDDYDYGDDAESEVTTETHTHRHHHGASDTEDASTVQPANSVNQDADAKATPLANESESSSTAASPAAVEASSLDTPEPIGTDEAESNSAPMIKTRLQKLAITSGKSFRFTVPAETFYDNEDDTNLRLLLTEKDGRELKPTSWLQFDGETRELYGLPLDDTVSKYQYLLSATDSGNESVTETVEISVQQHHSIRSVNHEVSVAVKINDKQMLNIDWQLKLIKAIADTLGDSGTDSIVVREVRQNPQEPGAAIFVYFNETLPTSSCPETELNRLVKDLDAQRLSELVSPWLGIKSISGQLIGACQKSHTTKPKLATPAKNIAPIPVNQVDRVNAVVGHLLVYKVPGDTFYDANDDPLKLSLKTKDNEDISPEHWLQFDSKNKEFYGIPKSQDSGREEEFILVAEDSGGLSATDALVVVVKAPPRRDYAVFFKAYLAIRPEQFDSLLQRKFVERIAELNGDQTTEFVQIRSISPDHDSDGLVVTFYNTTLFKSQNRCPDEQIDAMRHVYLMQDNILRERVKKVIGSELSLTNLKVLTGTCDLKMDTGHRDNTPIPTENEPTLKSSFQDYMYTVILPALIIITMILIASIIACCLHRRRRKSGKMELGDEEERKAFRKGIPVIFQDELDEKPEIGNKSPIILKDEKPPLLPPSYNTSNMNGDTDVDEYVPPPAVVMGGREARGKSPATPSYRKPPPYVSP